MFIKIQNLLIFKFALLICCYKVSVNQSVEYYQHESFESFFDYANQRASETEYINKDLFESSISSCPFAPIDYTNNEILNNFTREIYNLNNFFFNRAERLFLIDDFIMGVLRITDMSIQFYKADLSIKKLITLNKKQFYDEEPFDACVDNENNIFVVFPAQNKITKFNLRADTPSFQNLTSIDLKEETSIKDEVNQPSAISCNGNYIYVSQRTNSQIRVFDKSLHLVRIIRLNGVIVSLQKAMAVDDNIHVFVDGLDSVAMFNPTPIGTKNKISTNPETTRVNICHFFSNMNCIEDIDVYTEAGYKSSIYVVDSCDNEVKQFYYTKDKKILLTKRFKINSGSPISATRNSFGYLFVLTNAPAQIHVLDLKEFH